MEDTVTGADHSTFLVGISTTILWNRAGRLNVIELKMNPTRMNDHNPSPIITDLNTRVYVCNTFFVDDDL